MIEHVNQPPNIEWEEHQISVAHNALGASQIAAHGPGK